MIQVGDSGGTERNKRKEAKEKWTSNEQLGDRRNREEGEELEG